MYECCLYCHRNLGRNDEVELLPTGRRLAFDANRGRLWVICAWCGRWNLVPLAERWEAIEEAERLYRTATRRVSTEHIGMAVTTSGLELIGVGQPRLREFAAWRLGDKLVGRKHRHLRRRRSDGIKAGGAAVATGAALFLAGLPVAGPALVAGAAAYGLASYRRSRPDPLVATVPGGEGAEGWLSLRRHDLPDVMFSPNFTKKTWHLRLIGAPERGQVKQLHEISADTGRQSLSLLMPSLNRFGGRSREVEEAVRFVERQESTEAVFHSAATLDGYSRRKRVHLLPTPVRLALEIASSEASERRAAEGDLRFYERAWREAEELAAISDDLLLPRGVERMFTELQRRAGR